MSQDQPLLPTLVSLLRVPLAAAFPFCTDRPMLALGLLVAAGASDVLDGWIARRFDQATPLGAIIDPIADKLFVLVVVITLVVDGRLSGLQVALLATREVGELPLLVWWIFNRNRRHGRASHPMANVPGKLATVVQFAAVAAAILGSGATGGLVVFAAVAGGLAAATYWWRELHKEPVAA